MISRVALGVMSDKQSPHRLGFFAMAASAVAVSILWGVACEHTVCTACRQRRTSERADSRLELRSDHFRSADRVCTRDGSLLRWMDVSILSDHQESGRYVVALSGLPGPQHSSRIYS